MSVSEYIRDILLQTGGTYPSEVFRRLEEVYPRRTSLRAVLRNMAALKAIGLICLDGERPGTKLLRKRVYRVVPGTEDDPRWQRHPLHELYPATVWGGARYDKAKEEGLVKAGRARRYAIH